MAKQESIDFNQLRDFIETGHPISLSLIPTVSKKTKQKKSQKVQRKANKQNDTTIWQNRPTLKQNKPEHNPDIKDKDSKIDSAPQQIGNHTFQIQDHSNDCFEANRPCAFAIKYLGNQLYELYYRSTVYSKQRDNQFRHYLEKRPGRLVGLYYFKNLESLKYEMRIHKKELRHNGNNILSEEELSSLLHHFSVLRFL